tara:strand:- start:2963 stop:3628 length:666 start_codon:yes stop_codon:yes gene_type:complete
MADEKTADGQSGEAGAIADSPEYKALQRKYDRRNRSAKEDRQQMAEIRATLARSEATQEALLELFGSSDETLKPTVDGIRSRLSTRRQHDATTTDAEARISQTLDEADLDWGDEKLSEARRVLSEFKQTGNIGLVAEIERLVDAAKPSGQTGGSLSEDDLEAKIQERILEDRKATGRVDTGQSTAHDTRATRENIAKIDVIALGPRAAKDELNKIYDQMGI